MMNVVLDKVDLQGTVRVKYQPIQCSSKHKRYMLDIKEARDCKY